MQRFGPLGSSYSDEKSLSQYRPFDISAKLSSLGAWRLGSDRAFIVPSVLESCLRLNLGKQTSGRPPIRIRKWNVGVSNSGLRTYPMSMIFLPAAWSLIMSDNLTRIREDLLAFRKRACMVNPTPPAWGSISCRDDIPQEPRHLRCW